MIDIIIPRGPRHLNKLNAIKSAETQSVPCHVIISNDEAGRGPAWARNEGLRQATGDFIVFLDADDTISPDFVEKCLRRYEQGTYVFTAWTDDLTEMIHRPEADFNIYDPGLAHTVTTLIPRLAIEWVGGFDETLPGMEDIDLFFALHNIGVCGVYVDEPLFHYNRTQGSSPVSPDKPPMEIAAWLKGFYDLLRMKYRKEWGVNMCNCNDSNNSNANVGGPNSPEDVLVQTLFHARFSGPVTKRTYPKTNSTRQAWVHIADAQALVGHRKHPVLILPDPREIAPDTESVMDLLNEYGGGA